MQEHRSRKLNVKLKILISVFFISLFYAGSSYSADTGRATVYKVTMEELHFCEDAACAAYTKVCDTAVVADIASVLQAQDVVKGKLNFQQPYQINN